MRQQRGTGATVMTLVAVSVLVMLAGPVQGASLTVDTGGTDTGTCTATACLTINYALTQASASDTITVNAGTYVMPAKATITVSGLTLQSATPLGAVLQQPASKESVFEVTGATGVTISGFSFVIGDGQFTTGGGVFATGSASVTIEDCRFAGTPPLNSFNCIKFGAGVGVVRATAVIRRCAFDSLPCCSTGGGVYADAGSDVTVESSSFSNIIVSGAGGVGGGGIYYGSNTPAEPARMTVSSCTFTNNQVPFRNGGGITGGTNGIGTLSDLTFTSCTASNGGGIFDIGPTVTATNLVFTDNSASSSGGAYGVGVGSTLVWTGGSASGQNSQDGGAVYTKDATSVSITGVSFTSNTAQFGGGASLKDGTGAFSLTNVAFSANRALDRGGALLVRAQQLDMTNVTFTGNRGSSAGGAVDIQQTAVVTLTTGEFVNNVGDVGGGFYTSGTSQLTVSGVTLRDNTASVGGAAYFAQQSVSLMTGSLFSSNKALSSGGSVYGADTAEVAMVDTDLLLSSTPYGGGCAFFERQAVVNITRGRFANCTSPSGEGGAVFVRQTVRLTLVSALFEDNYTGSLGGALFVSGDVQALITNSTFQRNQAVTSGGAVYTERASYTVMRDVLMQSNFAPESAGMSINGDAKVVLDDVEFLDHTLGSPSGDKLLINGAGIGCTGSGGGNVTNSLFSRNKASASGGGLYTVSCVFNLTSVVFVDNRVGSFGGGVYAHYESTFTDVTLTTNSARWGGGLYLLTDDLVTRDTPAIVRGTFVGNDARGAGGAVYWEGTRPAYVPACVDCGFSGNTVGGYGPNEATAASRVVILSQPPSGTFVGSPPVSIEASRDFEVRVQIVDYYNATFAFFDPSARREMTAEVTAESDPVGVQNATVIGSNLVTVVDGFSDFSGLFLRGTQTQLYYNLVMQTSPASGVTKWRVFLEQCEAGFAEVVHPVFLFECIECPSGQFDLVRATTCSNCPEGAVCEGLTRIFPLENWWWDPSSPDSDPQLYYCIPNRCCPVSEPGNRCQRELPCADGWNQTSRLCSVCEDGKYEWNNKCIECGDSEQWRFLLVFVVCLVFVFLVFGFGSKLGGEMRIFLFFCQALSLVLGPVHPAMPYFGMSMGQLDILSIDDKCFVRLTPFRKLISQFTAPFLMLGLLTVVSGVYIFVSLVRRNRIKAVAGGEHVPWINTAPFLEAYINMFGICAIPLLHTSFQLLICRKVGTFFVLNQAPDVECYRGPHAKWVVFATVMTVFYTLVFPVSVYYYRRRQTNAIINQRFWHRNLELLRKKIYHLHMFWWELTLVARDVLMVLMYVLWFSVPKRRTLSILMVIFVFFFAHCYALPFRDQWDNGIETIGLVCLAYAAFVKSYSKRFQLSNERTASFTLDLSTYVGFAIVTAYISSRVAYELVGRLIFPFYHLEPSALDVHHTPHT